MILRDPHEMLCKAIDPLRRPAWLWVLLCGVLCARFPVFGAASVQVDPFASGHILEIVINLPAPEWERMRKQARDPMLEFGKERFDRPSERPYTWFEGEVVLDGVRYAKVGVRKRGYFGSNSNDRPAFNIDLDRYDKKSRFGGLNRLKLHNNQQDPSQIRQALSYQLFAAAGVPAPRCSFARVKVNGQDLGVYSHIDRIDDDFLDRHFGNHEGKLYEAALSDFRPGWIQTFQRKNGKESGGKQELEAVAQALQSDDATLIQRLERVLDVDAYINFWAVESLINHWDGFAGNQNNAFVYLDAKTKRLRFIPWGADGTFGGSHLFTPFQPPASVLAVSFLPRRLYNHPVTQERYRRRMKDLLATVWNESKLLAEVDRMEKLLRGSVTMPEQLVSGSLAEVRGFIAQRRSAIEAELAQPAQAWNYTLRRSVSTEDVAKVKVTFSTSWSTNVFRPPAASDNAKVELDFYGRHYSGTFAELRSGPSMDNPLNAGILLTGSFPGVSVPIHLAISLPRGGFQSGSTHELKFWETSAVLMAGHFQQPDFRMLAFSNAGTLRLEKAGMTEGTAVTGELASAFSMLPWEDFDLKALKPVTMEKR